MISTPPITIRRHDRILRFTRGNNFCSAFKKIQMISFSEIIVLSDNVYNARIKLYILSLSINLLSGINYRISYSVAGLTVGVTEGLQICKKRDPGDEVESVVFLFSCLAPTPSRQYNNYAFAFPEMTRS